MNTVKLLYDGDERIRTLQRLIRDICDERGSGLPAASVVGVLEFIKWEIITNSRNG